MKLTIIMAIWLQFFGEQRISKDIDTLETHIKQELEKVKLDFSFLKNNLKEVKPPSLFIKGKEPNKDYFIYNHTNWILNKLKDTISGEYIKLFYPLFKEKIHGGITVIIQKDLITVLGDMEHCGNFGLTKKEEIANGYLTFAEQLTKIFYGTKVLLCSEQIVNIEEREVSFETIEKECIESKVRKVNDIMEINHENYYISQIE